MTTTRTWIGGGNNKAANPHDWSPTGAPQPGDTLQVSGAERFTINVRGDALAGDTLDISSNNFNGAPVDTTVNLSHDATATALLTDGAHAIFNIADRVSASLQLGWRMARLSVADDGVVSGRSNGGCLASKPMEEQASCF